MNYNKIRLLTLCSQFSPGILWEQGEVAIVMQHMQILWSGPCDIYFVSVY